MTKKKATKKKAKKKTSSRVPKVLKDEVEENVLYQTDHTGILVNTKKIKAYGSFDGGKARGFFEYTAKKGYEFQTFCFGLTKQGEPLSVKNAKAELICLGYWPLDDIMDLMGKTTLNKISKALAEKYDLKQGEPPNAEI